MVSLKILRDSMTNALSVYKCYRSNALFFASLRDDYSVTLGHGQMFKFEKGEMLRCANGWADKARLFWQGKHVDDLGCLCPDCTRRAMTKGNCNERQ